MDRRRAQHLSPFCPWWRPGSGSVTCYHAKLQISCEQIWGEIFLLWSSLCSVTFEAQISHCVLEDFLFVSILHVSSTEQPLNNQFTRQRHLPMSEYVSRDPGKNTSIFYHLKPTNEKYIFSCQTLTDTVHAWLHPSALIYLTVLGNTVFDMSVSVKSVSWWLAP